MEIWIDRWMNRGMEVWIDKWFKSLLNKWMVIWMGRSLIEKLRMIR